MIVRSGFSASRRLLAGWRWSSARHSRRRTGWKGIPVVDTWTVPGLVLGVGFGLGSLLVGYGVWRRPRWPWLASVDRCTGHHWAWAGALLLGLGHVAWIVLELVYLAEPSILQAVYGTVGSALLMLALLPAVRRDLR
jgi:hypothetical protein